MEIVKYSIEGKNIGKLSLPKEIFSVHSKNFNQIQYEVINTYLTNQRIGSANVKFRSEIHGSRKKLYKQKGTGNARVGDKKTVLRRGGGRAFGPKPKNWYSKITKKKKRIALKLALSQLADNKKVFIIEDLNFDIASTKKAKTILNALNFEGRKKLILIDSSDKNIVKSFNNIKNTDLGRADSIYPYQILKTDCLIMTESAFKKIGEVYK